ncbi:putative ferric-chelate reductase 1 [Pygocentrus nattereri]|uniref:putative ferric-chelate reductase 1 n=1 Tax=Pygocentrus nattereri TaxID=42514 RepID=UPI0008144E39|nr:putative ferric-chelate reductase 1 [Pygocentrus nattereri]
MNLLLSVLVGICCWRLSSAYSDGSVAAVCDSMLPGHIGINPQTTTPPYRVRVNCSTYGPGDRITVTLEASQNGTNFQGFMLQARRTAGGTAGGSFRATNTSQFRLHSCFNMENSSISHASGEPKSLFEATWVAPLTPSLGNIQFCATFVRDYAEFWTMVSSGILSDGSVNKVSADAMCFCVLAALAGLLGFF